MKSAHDQSNKPGVSSPFAGTNQTGMRALNERLILTLIRQHGALSTSEIARHSGLTAQTVSVIIRALERDGLLLKGEPQRGRVGQPSVPIRLNPRGAYFLGLKIGRRSAEMVLTDFLGTILARRSLAYPVPAFDAVVDFSVQAAAHLAANLRPDDRARIAGLGIAMPFRLWDWADTPATDPSRMQAWQDRDIRAELAQALQVPVFVQKDASAACGAELVFGTGAQAPNFLYFYIGYFIGGGLVLNGSLFDGPNGNAGALGSVRVLDAAGRRCQLIDMASLMVLERALAEQGIDGATLWDSVDCWAAPQAVLDDWAEHAASGIAQAIQAAVAVVDVRLVKLDGWLPPGLRDALVERVRAHLGQADFKGLERPSIQAGTMGAEARVIGAASQPLLARFMTGFAR